MLASGGKILALGKVYTDEGQFNPPSLMGTGRPGDRLHVNPEWVVKQVNDKVSGASKEWVEQNFQPSGDYVSATDFNNYKTEVQQEFEDTSAWALNKFQPSGEYALKTDLKDWALSADVAKEFSATSAWANSAFQPKGNYQEAGDYVSADDFNKYKNEVSSAFSATSAWANDTFVTNNTFNTYSADIHTQLEQKFYTSAFSASFSSAFNQEFNTYIQSATSGWDYTDYSAGPGIKIEDHIVSLEPSAVPFDNYYTKDQTSGADQLSAEFNKYQPSGNYVEFEDMDELLEPYAFTSAVSGFHNTVLSADDTVDIDREILQDGTYKYTLHVEPGDVTQISAHRGISAEKNEDTGEWVIGLSDAVVSFGRFYQTLNDGENYYNKSELYGDTIEYDTTTNEIYLNPGIFHIDTQVNIVVPANIYDDAVGNYTIQVAPKIGSTVLQRPTVTREVENTYEHTETIELSFDVKIDSRKKFGISVTGLPAGVRTDYEIQNINIHEQITSIAQLEGGAGTTYIAGKAITISPDTNAINVNAGGGLEIDQATNTIKVKAGNGLKIIDTGALEGTLELNEVTAEVIQEVQKMKNDLQTKVTVNFDYANITGVTDFANQGNPNHTGVLLGFLFAVPINSTLYGPNDSQNYESVIGVYSKQVWNQSNIILGLYEYDPSYYNEQTHEWGRTVPKCDTGPINLKQGLNEFTIKHFNNLSETDKELKSGCLYYAAIYIPVDAGSGILLASCPGYGQNNTFNAKPQLTLDQANIGGYLQTGHYIKGKDSWPNDMNDLSFNNFGWGSWAGDYNFHELPEVPRFFMQIRNRVKTV